MNVYEGLQSRKREKSEQKREISHSKDNIIISITENFILFSVQVHLANVKSIEEVELLYLGNAIDNSQEKADFKLS